MADDDGPDLEAAYNLKTVDDSLRLYRNWAATYDDDFAARSGYRFARLIAEAYVVAGGQGPALDVGCGTGLVANSLPNSIVVDGIDISPEMLDQARSKERYRSLVEADLKGTLPLPDGHYAGLLCAGTFTHGHVGAEAMPELMRVLRPGAVCSITGKPGYFEEAGFRAWFDEAAAAGQITNPSFTEDRVYEAGADAPEGHADDIGYIIVFRKR